MKKLFLYSICLISLTGCGISQETSPIQGMQQPSKVCVRTDSATKEGFKQSIINWLTEHNYNAEVLPASGGVEDCKWTLTYYGKWSWDLAIYLSDAEIRAYNNGQYAGSARFHVQGGGMSMNLGKYGSADKTIRQMMDELFSQTRQ